MVNVAAVQPWSYGCTWEVCDSYASFMLSNLPRASITPWLHAARLPFLNFVGRLLVERATRLLSHPPTLHCSEWRWQKSLLFSSFDRSRSLVWLSVFLYNKLLSVPKHQFACGRLTLKGPVGELSIIVHYKRKSSTIAGWKRSLPRAIGATGQRTISSHDITNNTSHNASSLVGLWSRYTIDGFYCAKCQWT